MEHIFWWKTVWFFSWEIYRKWDWVCDGPQSNQRRKSNRLRGGRCVADGRWISLIWRRVVAASWSNRINLFRNGKHRNVFSSSSATFSISTNSLYFACRSILIFLLYLFLPIFQTHFRFDRNAAIVPITVFSIRKKLINGTSDSITPILIPSVLMS